MQPCVWCVCVQNVNVCMRLLDTRTKHHPGSNESPGLSAVLFCLSHQCGSLCDGLVAGYQAEGEVPRLWWGTASRWAATPRP